jgi:hypothetical protein
MTNLPTAPFNQRNPQVISASEEVIDDAALQRWLGNAVVDNLKVYRLKDFKASSPETCLVYGPSGAGKTYFCGTAGPRTLFINVGDGIKTLKSPEFKAEVPDAGEMIIVDVTEKLNEKGVTDTATAYDVTCKIIDYMVANFRDQFDTVVLDDATFLRKFAMNAAIQASSQGRSNAQERMAGLQKYVKPEIGEYGQEMAAIEWFLWTYVKRFKALGLNFILTAHERHVFGKAPKMGDEAPIQKIRPGFTGRAFPDFIPAFFDNVWHMEAITLGKGGTIHRLYTQNHGMAICKTRIGSLLPPMIQQPNFQKMIAHVQKQEQ